MDMCAGAATHADVLGVTGTFIPKPNQSYSRQHGPVARDEGCQGPATHLPWCDRGGVSGPSVSLGVTGVSRDQVPLAVDAFKFSSLSSNARARFEAD
jgi:hypothetical protein